MRLPVIFPTLITAGKGKPDYPEMPPGFPGIRKGYQRKNNHCKPVEGKSLFKLKMNEMHAGTGKAAGVAFHIKQQNGQAQCRSVVKKISGQNQKGKCQQNLPAEDENGRVRQRQI